MTYARFDDFETFVRGVLLPATADVGKLNEANRKHVQKLVYTNLVDRFDAMIDGAVLDHCRQDHLVDEAIKSMGQAVTEGDLVRLLMKGESLQEAIDSRLKDVLRITSLRQRHSRKLATLFSVLKPDEDYLHKPRVNPAKGEILTVVTPHTRSTPLSICGYADWLYSRRNSIVHGAGKARLLENDVKQLSSLYKTKVSPTFKIKLTSINTAAAFYLDVVRILKS